MPYPVQLISLGLEESGSGKPHPELLLFPWWHARALKPIWWATFNSTPNLRGAYLYYYYYYCCWLHACSTLYHCLNCKSQPVILNATDIPYAGDYGDENEGADSLSGDGDCDDGGWPEPPSLKAHARSLLQSSLHTR
jgi:hypothetical protein